MELGLEAEIFTDTAAIEERLESACALDMRTIGWRSPNANHRLAFANGREQRGGSATWASIAVRAGYYDHTRLIAEFRAIAGVTPRAFLGELQLAM